MPNNTDDTRLVTILLVIIGSSVVFPPFTGFWMMGFGPMTAGTSGGGTMSGWLFVVGTAMRLLFSAAIIGGGYLIYGAVAGSEGDSDRPIEELRLACARGDPTDEEYEQRREALERDTESRYGG